MKRLLRGILACVLVFHSYSYATEAATQFSGSSGLATDGAAIQAQMAELESQRLGQIKNALLEDFWTQYRIYIKAIAAGAATNDLIYPNWPLSSTPNDAKANFKYLADKYLPDLKDQIRSMAKSRGIAETDFYEIEYVPPTAGVPLPAAGHVIIRRLNAEVSTQGRLRGLLPSVTVSDIGPNGVISMRVSPPTAFMGSDALNASLVRNNGLTLDPILAQELASSETGGADMTFLPGTWVTFGKKGTNPGTAQAKGEDPGTVYTPTLRFKGKDGQVIGLNAIEMDQALGDPVARILFKRLAAATPGGMDANYIRFEDNRGAVIGVENIYRMDGPDGKSGENLDLAIWAHLALGGDFTILAPGDTINGVANAKSGTVRFGLGNTATLYIDASGNLKVDSINGVEVQTPTMVVDGKLDVTGTSEMQGNVVMRNSLNMSNTDITNVRNASVGSLTIAGKTGNSSGNAYNVWVANATYSSNAGLLGGKPEGSLSVNYANSAGTAGFATNAGNANTLGGKTLDEIMSEIKKNNLTMASGYVSPIQKNMYIPYGKTFSSKPVVLVSIVGTTSNITAVYNHENTSRAYDITRSGFTVESELSSNNEGRGFSWIAYGN